MAADKPRSAPPAQPATSYAAKDTHEAEKVTIAAEPCYDTSDCPFFRLPYLAHGFIPVRVIITNGSDSPLNLEQARIQFISAHNDKIPAATDEEINRRLFSARSAAGTKIPLIPVTIHHKPVDIKITEDNNDFGFKTTRVEPHGSLDGYLFYDVRGLDDPPLQSAELYVKQVYTIAANGSNGKELFAFTIPFNRWLENRNGSKATPQPKQ